jgi:hypothetical protein
MKTQGIYFQNLFERASVPVGGNEAALNRSIQGVPRTASFLQVHNARGNHDIQCVNGPNASVSPTNGPRAKDARKSPR